MSRKHESRDDGAHSKPYKKLPYHKQNDNFPGFDIAKNLKGSLPRDEVNSLFSVRVTNIRDVIKQDLFDFFKDYKVADIHIPWEYDQKTEDGKPVLKGVAFVRFKQEKDAIDSSKKLNNTELKGVLVGVAKYDENRKRAHYSYHDGARRVSDKSNYYKRHHNLERQGRQYRNTSREEQSNDYYTHHGSRPQGSYPRHQQHDRQIYRDSPQRYHDEQYYKRGRDMEAYDSYDRHDFRSPGRGYHYEQDGYRENSYSYTPRPNHHTGGGGYPPSEGKRRRYNDYNSSTRDGYQPQRNYTRDNGYTNDPSYGYSHEEHSHGRSGRFESRGGKSYENNRSEKRY